MKAEDIAEGPAVEGSEQRAASGGFATRGHDAHALITANTNYNPITPAGDPEGLPGNAKDPGASEGFPTVK